MISSSLPYLIHTPLPIKDFWVFGESVHSIDVIILNFLCCKSSGTKVLLIWWLTAARELIMQKLLSLFFFKP